MEVKSVYLESGYPAKVVIELDANSLALITSLVGKQTWDDMSKIHPKLPNAVSDFYDMATGDLFNRYYEDGIDGALDHLGR